MVLRPEPVAAALDGLRRPGLDGDPARPGRRAVPPGRARRSLAARDHLIFLCPRYEGVDERIRALVDVELSIGDYVLTGGELPALVVIDAVLRLLPGAIDAESTLEESFADGLLEYPQYTRPATFDGMDVPPILMSGDHGPFGAGVTARRSGAPSSAVPISLSSGRGRRSSASSSTSSAPRTTSRTTAEPVRGEVACYTPPSVVPDGPPPATRSRSPRCPTRVRNRRERARRDRPGPDPDRPARAGVGRHGQGVGQGRRG